MIQDLVGEHSIVLVGRILSTDKFIWSVTHSVMALISSLCAWQRVIQFVASKQPCTFFSACDHFFTVVFVTGTRDYQILDKYRITRL